MRVSNPTRRWEYVLECDRGDPNPTVFVLRRLTWEERDQCEAASPLTPMQAMRLEKVIAPVREDKRMPTDDEAELLQAIDPRWEKLGAQMTRMQATTVAFGLEAIRNVLDDAGAPMSMTPAEFIKHAQPAWIGELATEILRLSSLDQAERKN